MNICLKFDGLYADDTLQYRLTETAVPKGYTLLKTAVYEGPIPTSTDSDAYDLEYIVHNGRSYTMPATGGNGFSLLPLAGIFCAAGVGIILLYRKNRREK